MFVQGCKIYLNSGKSMIICFLQILHEPGFNFGTMPPLKEEVEQKTYLESNVTLLPGETRIEIIKKYIFATADGFLGVTNFRVCCSC